MCWIEWWYQRTLTVAAAADMFVKAKKKDQTVANSAKIFVTAGRLSWQTSLVTAACLLPPTLYNPFRSQLHGPNVISHVQLTSLFVDLYADIHNPIVLEYMSWNKVSCISCVSKCCFKSDSWSGDGSKQLYLALDVMSTKQSFSLSLSCHTNPCSLHKGKVYWCVGNIDILKTREWSCR